MYYKAGCLRQFASIKVCIGYKVDEKIPFKSRLLHKAEPIYKEFAGWKKSLNDCTNYDSLPGEHYLFYHLLKSLLEWISA